MAILQNNLRVNSAICQFLKSVHENIYCRHKICKPYCECIHSCNDGNVVEETLGVVVTHGHEVEISTLLKFE